MNHGVIFKVVSNFNDDFKMWVGRENLYTYSESPLYHLLLKLLEFFLLKIGFLSFIIGPYRIISSSNLKAFQKLVDVYKASPAYSIFELFFV